VKSLSQGKDHFILLDNPDTNVINIYKYDSTSRNFYNYQNIFHVHPINGLECFYAAGMIIKILNRYLHKIVHIYH